MKKILAFLVLISAYTMSCTSSKQTSRKPVEVVEGKLTLHPVFTNIKTKEEDFFFFLDKVSKTLFMTSDSTVFLDIVDHLPVKMVSGRSVLLQGSPIDPFTIFSKEQFEELGSKTAQLGVKLNQWRVVRIFNYGLIGESEPVPNKPGTNNLRWGDDDKPKKKISRDGI